MKTVKKIKDWYKHLKQPVKNQAITNLNTSCKNIKVNNLSDAIMLVQSLLNGITKIKFRQA